MLSTLNVIANHKNNCEDNFLVVEQGSIIYGGIFDGCSTGIHSAWASQTISYIVNFAIEQEIDILSDNFINYCLLSELEYMSERLNISHINFLSTCILFKYDKTNNIFSIRTFGDCYYYLNDIEYVVDQNNTPDYLGYQMFSKNREEFFKKYPILTYKEVKKFIVTSDGIEKINISQFLYPKHKEPLSLLFHTPSSNNFLQRMWNILKKEGYTVDDDLTIISYAEH